MARSLRKGPFVDPNVLKKMKDKKSGSSEIIKTWSRRCVISPEMVGFVFGVHNGKEFIKVQVNEDMVGHKLGEFSATTKFVIHGGKMQREMEQKKKTAEQARADQ